MDSDRVSNMVELAMAEKRKEYKEQTWEVYAVYSDGTFQLLSNLGYSIDGVDRKSFRVIKTYL